MVLIGRAADCDVVLTLPNLSWKHAELVLEKGADGKPAALALRDLSTNSAGLNLQRG